MARILMAGAPSYGLVYPSFPLTRALVDAGHHVDYLMAEAFRGGVEACGATLVPYADYLGGQAVTRMSQALRARRIFDDMTDGMIRLGGSYDAVVATGLQPQLGRAAAAVDRPIARFSPMFWQNHQTLHELMSVRTGLPGPVRHAIATRALRRLAGATGARAIFGSDGGDIVDLFQPRSTVLNLATASREYQPRADDFDDTCVYLGPTPTMAVTDPVFPLDRVRDHEGPVVYVTLGTVYNGWIRYFRTIAQAFAGTDTLVVIAGGRPGATEAIGPVADNVLVADFVPQAQVLAEADLCFTHGGFGSVTDAVALGATPVVTPLGGDQFFNAARIAQLDAGRVLSRFQVTVPTVRRIAAEILNGARPAGQTALAASFSSAGGPELGVRSIEALMS